MLKFSAILATGTLVFSSMAEAACPPSTVIAATKINSLDVMLMVSSLRCRATGSDFRAQYQRFRDVQQPTLAQAASTLQAEMGEAYDRFVTSIANQYGAGVPGLSCADLAQITASAAQDNVRAEALLALADQSGVSLMFDEGQCATLARR